jgi:hypothetical protein
MHILDRFRLRPLRELRRDRPYLDTPHWLISAYGQIQGQFSATSKNRVHN